MKVEHRQAFPTFGDLEGQQLARMRFAGAGLADSQRMFTTMWR